MTEVLEARTVEAESRDDMERIRAMNFNALDLNLVRVFDAMMQERSVTRAGDRIGLSQPAVSAALNRLRHIFNDSLFVRQGNEMLPTPLALEIGGHAGAALREIEAMVRSARGLDLADMSRTFTLMGADFFSMLLMPHLARKIHRQAPGVRLRLLDSARGDVGRLLQDNTIDVALERPLEKTDWMSSALLFKAPFVLIAARDNPSLRGVADGDVMPLDIFAALPHALRSIDGSMSGMVDEALATLGLKRDVTLALPHFQGVALAVAQGRHIAALPLQFARSLGADFGIRLFRPPIDIPVPDVNLYWHGRYDRDPANAWLRAQISDCVGELGFDGPNGADAAGEL